MRASRPSWRSRCAPGSSAPTRPTPRATRTSSPRTTAVPECRRRTMNGRAGFTLVEALVAIFVLAIGLLALLTLFPLGALTMAQAIRDDRAALASANGLAALQVWEAHR